MKLRINYNIKRFLLGISIFAVFFLIMILVNRDNMALLMGIFPKETYYAGSYNFNIVCKWLWFVLPLWFANGFTIDAKTKYVTNICYRHGSFGSYYCRIIYDIGLNTIIYAIYLYVTMLCFYERKILVFLMICIYGLWGTVWIFFLKTLIKHTYMAVITVIILNFFLCIIGDRMNIHPLFNSALWGMYNRSAFVLCEDGFSFVVVLLVQCLFSSVVVIINRFFMEKRLKEGK